MNLFRDLEKHIDERLRRLFGSPDAGANGRALIEVQRFILDRIEERVQSLPRARRIFPYNHVAVRIPVRDAEQRAVYEAVFAADNALRDEVYEALRRDGVEVPKDLAMEVTLFETAELIDPMLSFRKTEAAAANAAVQTTQSVAGAPKPASFTPLPEGTPVLVRKSRIHVGRVTEVLDDRRRPVRRNDVVLDHGTVSRAHAHLELTEGEFRLFDDGSSYGTSVLHEGSLSEAPRAGTRGLRLWPGDEIYFGQARVRFDLSDE